MRHLRWLFLCLLPVLAQATIYQVPFNQRTRLSVSAGDILRLYGFPSGWPYNQIISGFDAKDTTEMSFAVSCQGVVSNVSSWTANTYCSYAGTSTQDMTVTSGSAIVDFTWWVAQVSSSLSTSSTSTSSSLIASSSATNSQQHTSSSSAYVPYALHELPSGQPLDTTGVGGLFRISQYPAWNFNVIVVQVIPYDGKPLAGYLVLPSGSVSLSGWSQKIIFREHGSSPAIFELALPEQRRLGISWWADNQVPDSLPIPASQVTSGDSLSITYNFSSTHLVPGNLHLSYVKSDFSDGLPPRIVRLSHNPIGVRYPDRPLDQQGPTYKISATPASGKTIVAALPIPQEVTQFGIPNDSLSLMHYDESTGTWNEVKPDSIVNGYIYFSSGKFSCWVVRWTKKAGSAISNDASAAGSLLYHGALALGSGLVDFTSALTDGLVELYNKLVSGLCSTLSVQTYKDILNNNATVALPQGDLTEIVNSPYFTQFESTLNDYVNNVSLAPLATTHSALSEVNNFITSRNNVQILLADVLLARHGAPRKYLPNLGSFAASSSSNALGQYEPAQATQAMNLEAVATIEVTSQSSQSGLPVSALIETNSTMLSASPRILQVLQECSCMFGLDDEYEKTKNDLVGIVQNASKFNFSKACRSLLGVPLDLVGWVWPEILDCAIDAGSLYNYYNENNLKDYWNPDPNSPILPGRDDHINRASELLNVLSILVWADDGYKAALGGMAANLRNQIDSYIGFVHDGYSNNNIMIKAKAGVALWDLVAKNDKTAYNKLKAWLEAKTGDSGGYSEGSGYLQYVDIDVPYVLAVMVRAGLITRDELPQKYLKHAEWLRNIGRPLPTVTPGTGGKAEFLPVTVDDGNVMPPDFYVFSYLKNDPSLAAFGDQFGAYLFEPMRFLGLPPIPIASTVAPKLPDLYFADGVGVIRDRAANGDTLTMSIIAESGAVLDSGDGHEQQDNMSVTLDRSGIGNGPILLDPAFPGFSKRESVARFSDHNVCMLPENVALYGGENPNGKIHYSDLFKALRAVPGVYNMGDGTINGYMMFFMELSAGFSWVNDDEMTKIFNGTRSVIENDVVPKSPDAFPGGSPAYLDDSLTHIVAPFFHGLEVKHTSNAGVTNHRAILSFADHLWIIDRPDQAREMWLRWNYLNSQALVPSVTFVEPLSVFPVSSQSVPSAAVLGALDTNIGVQPEGSLDPVYMQHIFRRTRTAGATGKLPVFVSAYPVTPDFVEVLHDCINAECLARKAANGDSDMVIVPQWGTLFDATALLSSTTQLFSGTVIFAHKQAGAISWSAKSFGEEDASLTSKTTLKKITASLPANTVIQVGPVGISTVSGNGTSTVILPGTRISLPALQLLLFQ